MRLPEQVTRLGFVIAAIVAMVLLLRFVILPETMFSAKPHQAATVTREMAKPLHHAGVGVARLSVAGLHRPQDDRPGFQAFTSGDALHRAGAVRDRADRGAAPAQGGRQGPGGRGRPGRHCAKHVDSGDGPWASIARNSPASWLQSTGGAHAFRLPTSVCTPYAGSRHGVLVFVVRTWPKRACFRSIPADWRARPCACLNR